MNAPCRYKIPAGTGLWTPLATIHNADANWGATTSQYLPERWLQPGADYVQSPTAGDISGSMIALQRSTVLCSPRRSDAGANGGNGGGGESNDDLKHATATTARNFEMSISRAKVCGRTVSAA